VGNRAFLAIAKNFKKSVREPQEKRNMKKEKALNKIEKSLNSCFSLPSPFH
jgi:hypothetical protein